MLEKLEGYKTYILVVLLIITGVLHSQSLINNELAVTIYGILGPLLGITIRHGMKKDNEKLGKELESKLKLDK